MLKFLRCGKVEPVKKIYLAGPMLDCDEEQINGWRQRVKKELGHLYEFLDPVDFQVEKKDTPDCWEKIVMGDLKAIENADIVLAYVWRAGCGTAMEVMSAFVNRKIVVVVNPIKSPWINYFSTVRCENLDGALNLLKEKFLIEGKGIQ